LCQDQRAQLETSIVGAVCRCTCTSRVLLFQEQGLQMTQQQQQYHQTSHEQLGGVSKPSPTAAAVMVVHRQQYTGVPFRPTHPQVRLLGPAIQAMQPPAPAVASSREASLFAPPPSPAAAPWPATKQLMSTSRHRHRQLRRRRQQPRQRSRRLTGIAHPCRGQV
jgi:hypothetical protein